ncbi:MULTISPECIES: mechanosensitive ion channel family protein [unclassified Francisella]|uniref:mechanosensitive ion channel family protein n=1 Tax=unclassified Francisella TaxID=2610885 RepID=UPI002E353588|nr:MULTISPECIES: mechanosensitive ion channel domain-containing protein [unclassified Francisella]MED7818444.1 mechanosensitive ion channel [Francisella sp. 19S2-4]MED7829301.1 mechanosensitive ion channel [Francisella sp. 19S2-10]
MNQLKDFYASVLSSYSDLAGILSFLTIFIIILACSWIVNKILKRYIVTIVNKFVIKIGGKLGETLINYKVFNKLSHIGPGIFIYLAINLGVSSEHDWTVSLVNAIQLISQIYITLTIILFCIAFIDAIFNYFQKLPYFKHHSLKSYAQIIKIILYFLAFVLVVSQLLNKSPIAFLTGLGALSAVLMLVFKDTILGFVSNIQVAALDLVRVGDWITIPSAGVDGDVMEVSINTVKIRNFDKTISTVPTYTLINNSVQNWRGMVETGGRRIKRSINIDIDTIKFCDPETLESLKKEPLLKDYIISKQGEKLTNITLFRAYIENYLRNHPKIHTGLTFLIRELQSSETGVPVELYIFTNDTNWVNYEKIQADIFDYVFASLHMFDLKAFQAITGRISK